MSHLNWNEVEMSHMNLKNYVHLCRLRGSNPEANFIRSHSDRENEAGINGSYFIYIRELNLLFSLGAIAAAPYQNTLNVA